MMTEWFLQRARSVRDMRGDRAGPGPVLDRCPELPSITADLAGCHTSGTKKTPEYPSADGKLPQNEPCALEVTRWRSRSRSVNPALLTLADDEVLAHQLVASR